MRFLLGPVLGLRLVWFRSRSVVRFRVGVFALEGQPHNSMGCVAVVGRALSFPPRAQEVLTLTVGRWAVTRCVHSRCIYLGQEQVRAQQVRLPGTGTAGGLWWLARELQRSRRVH
jgi:hypothetical protein